MHASMDAIKKQTIKLFLRYPFESEAPFPVIDLETKRAILHDHRTDRFSTPAVAALNMERVLAIPAMVYIWIKIIRKRLAIQSIALRVTIILELTGLLFLG